MNTYLNMDINKSKCYKKCQVADIGKHSWRLIQFGNSWNSLPAKKVDKKLVNKIKKNYLSSRHDTF